MTIRHTPDCDCCEGTGADTPKRIGNPPGQTTLDYRIGRHADYLAAIEARLSSSGTPALAGLTTRESSDLTLAIADALACSLDVLGFYGERYAHEHYLRSATERLSVREMARLIGYRLKPGVAAATHLAFTLQDTPGAPTDPIRIPTGTRVQSVPGQDEQAQTFETVAEVPASAAWNAIPVQHDETRFPAFGDTELWLAGSDNRLEVGDLLLIVGSEHLADPSNERWDVRVLSEIETFPERDLTRVGWAEGLGHSNPFVMPAGEGIRLYTFRNRTSAFGANAADWRAMSDETKAGYIGLFDTSGQVDPSQLTAADQEEWPEFTVRAPVYPERREGDSIIADQVFVPPTIAEVAAAAQSAAQGAAAAAFHQAAASGTGMVMAGGEIAQQATGFAQHSAEALAGVARSAVDEVVQRARTLVGAQAQTLQALRLSAEQLVQHSALDHARQLVADRIFDLPRRVQAAVDAGLSDPLQIAADVLENLQDSIEQQVPEGLLPDLQPIWDEAVSAVTNQVGALQVELADAQANGVTLDWIDVGASGEESAGAALARVSGSIDALAGQLEVSGDASATIVRDVVDKIQSTIGTQLADTDLSSLLDVSGVANSVQDWTASLLDAGGNVGAAVLQLQQSLLGSAGTLFTRLGQDIVRIAEQTQGSIAQTAELLNAGEALGLLQDAATRLRDHGVDAGVSTLRAAGASEVAALVTTAVQLARDLPPPFAVDTPEALADVARFFAAYGVARSGGGSPLQPLAGSPAAQVLAQLPAALQGPLQGGEELLALIDDADMIANARFSGANAAQEQILAQIDKALLGSFTIGTSRRAPLVRSADRIDITPLNESVVAGGWALLAVPNSIELYRITEVTSASRAEYLVTGQTTRLRLSGELPHGTLPAEFEHAVRSLAVHIESEELMPARTPLAAPLYGDQLSLDGRVEDLVPGQALALTGRRPRIRIARSGNDLAWLGDDGETRLLAEGDSLVLLAPPERLIGTTAVSLSAEDFAAAVGRYAVRLRLVLEDRDGAPGHVDLRGSDIQLAEPDKDDAEVAEIVFLSGGADAVTHDRDRSHLRLTDATRHCYVRLGTRLNANVAPATHGETVEALLGSGDGSSTNQSFTLNQAPLTHVSADTPGGTASTLEVRVNDVLWQEQRTLYQAAAEARVYRTLQDDDGVATIEFGDGNEGARLPSGESNVRARYRKGLGVAGNVGAGKLTTLLSRPLGVAEVSNPEAATGGEDGETLERARDNAPLTVLTLDRAVSITDYADYARAFAGIDKAHALWIPAGPARGVFLSIAGVDGAVVPDTSDTYRNLSDSLRNFGDPLLLLRILNFRDARFRCRLAVKVFADHETDPVISAVESALVDYFAFARRSFGQTVSIDEVAAVAQAVSGVEAVHITHLYRAGQAAGLEPRLFAELPVASLTEAPLAAELLTLADEPIELEVLP